MNLELEAMLLESAAQAAKIAEGSLQGRVTEMFLPVETLHDAWLDVIGSVEGTGEPHSENTSERFAQAMLEKKQTGHL